MSTTQEALRIAKHLHDSIHGDAYLGQPKERELIRELVAALAEPPAQEPMATVWTRKSDLNTLKEHWPMVAVIGAAAEKSGVFDTPLFAASQTAPAQEADVEAVGLADTLEMFAPFIMTAAALLRSKQAPTVAVGDEGKRLADEMTDHAIASEDEKGPAWDEDAADLLKRGAAALRARAEQREAPGEVVGEDQMREAADAIRPKRSGVPLSPTGFHEESDPYPRFPADPEKEYGNGEATPLRT